jgi:hypothetical protein
MKNGVKQMLAKLINKVKSLVNTAPVPSHAEAIAYVMEHFSINHDDVIKAVTIRTKYGDNYVHVMFYNPYRRNHHVETMDVWYEGGKIYGEW